MAQPTLESLLFRIRDGAATGDDIALARELVQADPRLPDELKEVVDFEEAESDAVGLLAVLGADSLFGDVLREGMQAELAAPEPDHSATRRAVGASDARESVGEDALSPADRQWLDADWPLGNDIAAAVAYEAGEVEVLQAVFLETGLAEQDDAWLAPIADAVHFEAGPVDVVGAVLQTAGLEDVQIPLAQAIAAEGGSVELADDVLARCGLSSTTLPIAAAIAGEAGQVEVSTLIADIEAELTELRLPLAAAVASEAGSVEVVGAVFAELGLEEVSFGLVAEAVRAEAGTVDVWPELEAVVSDAWISAMLDHQLAPAAHRAAVQRLQDEPGAGAMMTAFASIGSELRTAVAKEAGPCPYVWASVAEAIGVDAEAVEGWDGAAFAAAVRAEAGEVAVAAAVMQDIARLEARAYPRRAAVVEVESVELPKPANSGWSTSTLLMAAAALLLFTVLPFGMNGVFDGGSDTGGSEPVVSVETGEPVQFASAGEIVIENLDYADDAAVMQTVGDDGALILWVEDGATL
jgi:hypothetical protein